MGKFRIDLHGRLQEWVAQEKGYFTDEGLDYEFATAYAAGSSGYALVQSTETAAPEVKRGAFDPSSGAALPTSAVRVTGRSTWPRPQGMGECGGMLIL